MLDWVDAETIVEINSLFNTPPPSSSEVPPPFKNNEKVGALNCEVKKDASFKLWSAKGRLRRSDYWGQMILYALIIKGLFYFGENELIYYAIEYDVDYSILSLLLFCVAIPFIVLIFIQAIKRLHDMNISGWVSFIIMIPLINLILLFWDGTVGPNKFGEDPKNRLKKVLANN